MNWVLKHLNPEYGLEGTVCKIINIGIPRYLNDFIPKHEIGNNIGNGNKPFFNCRTESFKNSFFPYTIEAWYSLDP